MSRNRLLVFGLVTAVCVSLSSCEKEDSNAPASSNSNINNGGGGPAPNSVPIGVPVLQLPANNATGIWAPYTFTWSAVEGATSYDIFVYRVSNGVTVFSTSVSSNSYFWGITPTPSVWENEYIRWRVKANNFNGGDIYIDAQGEWSPYSLFRMNQ